MELTMLDQRRVRALLVESYPIVGIVTTARVPGGTDSQSPTSVPSPGRLHGARQLQNAAARGPITQRSAKSRTTR